MSWLDDLIDQISESGSDAIPSEPATDSTFVPSKDSSDASKFFSAYFGNEPSDQKSGSDYPGAAKDSQQANADLGLTRDSPFIAKLDSQPGMLDGLTKSLGMKKDSSGSIDWSDPKTIDAVMKMILGGGNVMAALMHQNAPTGYKSAAQLQAEIKSPLSSWTPQQQANADSFFGKPMQGPNHQMMFAANMPSPLVPGKGYADGGSVAPFSSSSPNDQAWFGDQAPGVYPENYGGPFGISSPSGTELPSGVAPSVPQEGGMQGNALASYLPPSFVASGGYASPGMRTPSASMNPYQAAIQARNNYAIGTPERSNYGNYLTGVVNPLRQQFEHGGGASPLPVFDSSQAYQGNPGPMGGFRGPATTSPLAKVFNQQPHDQQPHGPLDRQTGNRHPVNSLPTGPLGIATMPTGASPMPTQGGMQPTGSPGGPMVPWSQDSASANAYADGGSVQPAPMPGGPQTGVQMMPPQTFSGAGQPPAMMPPTGYDASPMGISSFNPPALGSGGNGQPGINANNGGMNHWGRGFGGGGFGNNMPPGMRLRPGQGFARGGALGHVVAATGGQDDVVPIRAAGGEYMWDADTVSALGDGNNAAGARKLDQARENIRAHKRSAPVDKIPPKAKSLDQYMKGAK